jgi:YesN/AraC family two-component response regulator
MEHAMKKKTILLVDDEQLILDSLSRELTSAPLPFEVSLAINGEEAVGMIADRAPDLVITDLRMPGLDGYQVLKAAKRKDPHTMVIILTGYADMQSAIDALRLGADEYLQKPCDPDELLYRVSSCSSKQDLQRKVAMYENILPVCSYCKRIRDDRPGEQNGHRWYSLEEYFVKVQGIHCSHGCCPDCFAKLFPVILEDGADEQ